jgi:NAD(P)-dependent dehydrogenase (short-subunit alcohol dehydrogenase family)
MPDTKPRVLVTGATRGIGRAIAVELVSRGASVYATGRNEALLSALLRETGCAGRAFDLADPAAALELYAGAKEYFDAAPDVLVNNAGFNSRKSPIMDVSLEDFDAQYAVNLRAPFLLCREALKDMAAARHGHIVNVISSAALFANETMGVYTAMKTGLRGFTGVLIKEARQFGVKVSGVYPGGVDTEFRKNARPDYMKPESVARMIVDAIYAPDDVVVHDLVFRPMVEGNF